MFKRTIDFNKCFKPVLIGYAIFMVIGIILTLIKTALQTLPD